MAAGVTVGRRLVSISPNRRMTIPRKFFDVLNFGTMAECLIRDGELVLRPTRSNGVEDFSEEILTELVSEGLSGDDLLSAFRARRKRIRPAVESMLEAAREAAYGVGEYEDMSDVFGEGE